MKSAITEADESREKLSDIKKVARNSYERFQLLSKLLRQLQHKPKVSAEYQRAVQIHSEAFESLTAALIQLGSILLPTMSNS